MSYDEGNNQVPAPENPAAASPAPEARRLAARRRFLRRSVSATGSGLVIYTVHHTRVFASNKILVSSPTACTSLGGSDAKEVKAVDSINPVQKLDKDGNPLFDKNDNPIYEETVTRIECTVK